MTMEGLPLSEQKGRKGDLKGRSKGRQEEETGGEEKGKTVIGM